MQTITIIDAREVDGTPYQAAEAAVSSAMDALDASEKALETAFILARNAGLQRQIDLGREPDPDAWTASAEAAKIIKAGDTIQAVLSALVVVKRAVAYDPTQDYA